MARSAGAKIERPGVDRGGVASLEDAVVVLQRQDDAEAGERQRAGDDGGPVERRQGAQLLDRGIESVHQRAAEESVERHHLPSPGDARRGASPFLLVSVLPLEERGQ